MENVELKTIHLPESKNIDILAISVRCRCSKCGWIWGVYLNSDGKTPPHYDTCKRSNSINQFGYLENVK